MYWQLRWISQHTGGAMAGGTTRGPRLSGWRRLALRLPIWLYRARLGWLLGERFLLLVHTGRATGRVRRTVLEVVAHDREARVYLVASGWGERADWLRNVMQHPAVQIVAGRRRLTARARRLAPPEAARALATYAAAHPAAFRALVRVMLGEQLRPGEAGYAQVAARVPLVALEYGVL